MANQRPNGSKGRFPNDADGDALRRVEAGGSDLSKPMDIDFFVAVPDQQAGDRFAAVARGHGFSAKVEFDAAEPKLEDESAWTCYCTKTMIASYDAVVGVQKELDELSRPFGGHTDGWGTMGNG